MTNENRVGFIAMISLLVGLTLGTIAQADVPSKISDLRNSAARDIFGSSALGFGANKRLAFKNDLMSADQGLNTVLPSSMPSISKYSTVVLQTDACMAITSDIDYYRESSSGIAGRTYGVLKIEDSADGVYLELGNMYENPHTVRLFCRGLSSKSDVRELWVSMGQTFLYR
jgi:hypothetical protein